MENFKQMMDQIEQELEDTLCRKVEIVAIKQNKRGDYIAIADIKDKKIVVRKPYKFTIHDLAV